LLSFFIALVGAARPNDDLADVAEEPFDLDDLEDGMEGGDHLTALSDIGPDSREPDQLSESAVDANSQGSRMKVSQHSFVEAASNETLEGSGKLQPMSNWQKCKKRAGEFHDTRNSVINDWHNPDEWKKIGDTLEMILGESDAESPVLTLLTVVRIIQGEMTNLMADINDLTEIANGRQAEAGMKKIADKYFDPSSTLSARLEQLKVVRSTKDTEGSDLLGDFIDVVSANPDFGQYFRRFYPRTRGKGRPPRGPKGEILMYWYPYELAEQILFIVKKYFNLRWIEFWQLCTPQHRRYEGGGDDEVSVEKIFWHMAEIITAIPPGDTYTARRWRKELQH